MNNLSIKNNFLPFGKRDKQTGRQDREHSVAIFGTTKNTPHTNPELKLVAAVAKKLAQKDFDIWTGGCPGIAESANQAASKVNPKTSWALNVFSYDDETNQKIRNKKIFNEKQTPKGIHMETFPAARTVGIINECDHAIIASGGTGTQQEIGVCFESKAYTVPQKDLCPNNIVLINNKGFYDPLIDSFDKIENVMYPNFEQIDGFPLKVHKLKNKVINKEVKIDKKQLSDEELDKLSTSIVNQIIEEANKKSSEKVEPYRDYFLILQNRLSGKKNSDN